MGEFPWGQMFTAIAALGGAAIGSWGTSWGAVRREKIQREADAAAATESRRVTDESVRHYALVDFCNAYLRMAQGRYTDNVIEAHAARSKFVATLRAGEASVAEHTLALLRDEQTSSIEAAENVDQLYAWWRGETDL